MRWDGSPWLNRPHMRSSMPMSPWRRGANPSVGDPEVGYQPGVRLVPNVAWRAQHRRWMDGGQRWPEVRLEDIAVLTGDAKFAPEERLRRRRSQRDDQSWADPRHLRLQPGAAGLHLAAIGLLMDPSLPRWSAPPLEMLDDVRHVHLLAIDPRLDQGSVEQLACRTHERRALDVLAVSGLLP